MRRNCPHCGQEQVIADAEIQAPWIFTRCHGCESLSILRKEGAPEPIAPKKPKAAPAPAPERKIAAPSPTPVHKLVLTEARAPSLAAREIRAETVLGAFASAARERPETYRPPILFEEEKELTLPSYYSPYNADAETVVCKTPPATPAFLKRARSDAPQESALEPLAQAIREEAMPKAEPVEGRSVEAVPAGDELPELPELDLETVIDEDFPDSLDENHQRMLDALLAAPASAANSGGTPERSAPPSSGGSPKRRQRLIGAGALLIGVGFGLLFLKPRPRAPEPEPETIPAFAPQPAAYVPVKPAPVLVPPAPVTPSPADLASATAARVPSGFWIVSVSGAKTSLRAGPGKDFKVLGEVETGSRWKVRKWDGEWFQVEPENLGPETLGIGWIRNDLVKPVGNGGSF